MNKLYNLFIFLFLLLFSIPLFIKSYQNSFYFLDFGANIFNIFKSSTDITFAFKNHFNPLYFFISQFTRILDIQYLFEKRQFKFQQNHLEKNL